MLAAVADIMIPMVTAALCAGGRRANWEELADFRNIKKMVWSLVSLLMAQYCIKPMWQVVKKTFFFVLPLMDDQVQLEGCLIEASPPPPSEYGQ